MKTDQAVFELAQAMGGGETRRRVSLRLLAAYPYRRPSVTSQRRGEKLDAVVARIPALNGRKDFKECIWCESGTQLTSGPVCVWAIGTSKAAMSPVPRRADL